MNTDLFSTPDGAQSIHDRLLKLLEPEKDKTFWMEFVRIVLQHIPALSNRGRPPADVIASSFVGTLGFSSWKDYVVTPVKNGGLGWSATTWKRWTEAYALTQAHGWIATGNFSADEVRSLARDYSDGEWPQSLEQHLQAKARKAESKRLEREAKKAADAEKLEQVQRIPVLELQVLDLQKQVQAQQDKVDALLKTNGQLEGRCTASNQTLEQVRQELETLRKKHASLSNSNQTSKAELHRLRSLPWWGRLIAVFQGL